MREIKPRPANFNSRLKTIASYEPHSLVTAIAAEVIRRSDKEHPADGVLRHELMRQRRPSPELKSEVTNALFSYFRWLRWLNPEMVISSRIDTAIELAQRFSDQPKTFPDNELVAKAVPDWARQQTTITPELARALQTDPKLWLRAKRGKRDDLVRQLGECTFPESKFLNDAIEYRGQKDLFRLSEFHAGEFELQDISSQAVGIVCDPKPGETWWDACAGEGGKTLHLSELMENKGLIWASDRADWRLKNLKRRAGRAKVFNYRAALWEGSEKLPTKTKFDGVLVDAPCSGTGTWQRNPHARWTTTIEDVFELAEVQLKLLANVSKSVKPGGKLIYSVCTLTKAETTEVAAKFQERFSHFQPLPLKNPFAPEEGLEPSLWFWPQRCRGNGMFVAAWRRRV